MADGTTGGRERSSQGALIFRVAELERRMNNLEGTIEGVDEKVGKIKDRLNIWGSLIVGGLLASGLLQGDLGRVLSALGAGG